MRKKNGAQMSAVPSKVEPQAYPQQAHPQGSSRLDNRGIRNDPPYGPSA